jgi:hypothetical protein
VFVRWCWDDVACVLECWWTSLCLAVVGCITYSTVKELLSFILKFSTHASFLLALKPASTWAVISSVSAARCRCVCRWPHCFFSAERRELFEWVQKLAGINASHKPDISHKRRSYCSIFLTRHGVLPLLQSYWNGGWALTKEIDVIPEVSFGINTSYWSPHWRKWWYRIIVREKVPSDFLRCSHFCVMLTFLRDHHDSKGHVHRSSSPFWPRICTCRVYRWGKVQPMEPSLFVWALDDGSFKTE